MELCALKVNSKLIDRLLMQTAISLHGPFQLGSGRPPPFERNDERRPQEHQRHATALQTQEDLPSR